MIRKFEKTFKDKRLWTQWNTSIILDIVWSLLKSLKTNVKTSTGKTKVVEDSNVYDWPCFLFANAIWKFQQLTLKWLSGARAQDKNKQDYNCFHFFLFSYYYAIQENSLPDEGISS